MKRVLSFLPLLLAAPLAAQAPPACAEAALASAPDEWIRENLVSGDLTLDGQPDVAFWKADDGAVLVFLAACDGDRAVETWRFSVPLTAAMPKGASPVQLVTPLLDQALIDRVCATGRADECEHMRQENRRRQVTADAGGRELRIGPGPDAVRLRWSGDHHGFMRIGG